jgi:hypothetical protein
MEYEKLFLINFNWKLAVVNVLSVLAKGPEVFIIGIELRVREDPKWRLGLWGKSPVVYMCGH